MNARKEPAWRLVRRLLLQQRQAAQQIERAGQLIILGRARDLLALRTGERLLVLRLGFGRGIAFSRLGGLALDILGLRRQLLRRVLLVVRVGQRAAQVGLVRAALRTQGFDLGLLHL